MSTEPCFFEIGARTNFSFLEGAARPEEMMFVAGALNMSGIGIADRNSVAGVVRAHNYLREMHEIHARQKKEGVKGDEEEMPSPCRFQPGARLVFSDETPDILAYPCNRRGWANLCRLLSRGNLRTTKGSCILEEWDILEWGAEMMLAIVADPACLSESRSIEKLEAVLGLLKERFDKAIYLALSPAYDGRDAITLATLAGIAGRTGIPLIATNQPLYHLPDRKPLSDVVTAIREHVTVAGAGFRLAPNAERHLKYGREMARVFRNYPQAITNTERFFKALKFSLDELQHNYPDESVVGETLSETLERLTWEGAKERYPDRIPAKVAQAIVNELDLIRGKEYEAYFLTVRHIVWHARHRLKVLCQGRGSAANSAVCYCLGITEVNPENSTLLFERFISTERHEPPDIDVDFEHERREEVVQYIYEHYGFRHAGLTAAVTSYRTRMAGREVAKAFGLSEDVQAALSSTVWGWSQEGVTERDARAAGLDLKDKTTLKVMKYAQELMGFPRHLTQHVGGFLITRDRLDEVVPIMPTAMPGRYMIEWDKDDLDTLKLLKIDVLALGMLTCLRKAFELMRQHYGREETLAGLNKGNRPEVYDMICRADTIGVFQIESRAQMSMLPRLRPRVFYDLVVEVAIVRPGPIQGNMVHPYLKRREDERHGLPIIYPSPELKEVLKRTLGIPLFQEQAMQIAMKAAGFPAAKADALRRSMATFKRSGRVNSFKQDMINGMLANGYAKEFAESCFKQIEGFAEYGFPESHAASFALLVYVSSWIKAFYPDVFCTALLNSQPMGFYAPSQLVRDAREHGVEVLPVDVNHSDWDSSLKEAEFDRWRVDRRHVEMRDVILTRHAVQLGFRQVKGLSEKAMREKLMANRGDGYHSVRDLWLRSGLEKADVERLADADAFRSMRLSRREALWAVRALDARSAAEKLPLFDQVAHLDLQVEPKTQLPEMLPGEEVIEDYRALSLSLKAHPVSFLRDRLQAMDVCRSVDLLNVRNGRKVTIAGLVLVRQRPGSAKGVIFMTLEDETGVANAIVWPKTFEKYRPVVMGARLVKIFGRLQSQNGVIHTVVDHIEDLTPMLGLLQTEVRRFAVLERADEVLNGPRPDPRQSRKDRDLYAGGSVANVQPGLDTARVMPKGRNFH
ncbi:DNA polymerase-3 subunit alpha/error-prone DNA polymerase [Neorhizobium huautlense]|uniref:Error-prone DNA polymerase n=1 Tax=Neorhizobium huautlense TaxID=67774 RepID=A0ABT9PZS1_9HYPH|nr:error-prone DNA polymerase [Neorhizobium huautlense]MDP9839214.1 DNA polymerase-3 subunit alpha/error-prone DNA polymerase [Neorhizobium huautlense]